MEFVCEWMFLERICFNWIQPIYIAIQIQCQFEWRLCTKVKDLEMVFRPQELIERLYELFILFPATNISQQNEDHIPFEHKSCCKNC